MTEISAAWSEQARAVLGEALPGALEAFAHNATVREIIKIHGPTTTLWVQAVSPSEATWALTGSYQTPEGDAVSFKTLLPRRS